MLGFPGYARHSLKEVASALSKYLFRLKEFNSEDDFFGPFGPCI